jgi:hypothetical protein
MAAFSRFFRPATVCRNPLGTASLAKATVRFFLQRSFSCSFPFLMGFGEFHGQGLVVPSRGHGVYLSVGAAALLGSADVKIHFPVLHFCTGRSESGAAMALDLECQNGRIPFWRLDTLELFSSHASSR